MFYATSIPGFHHPNSDCLSLQGSTAGIPPPLRMIVSLLQRCSDRHGEITPSATGVGYEGR